jgi:hypothetical protein
MAELTDTEIDAAVTKGKTLQKTEPRAAAVRYDARTHHVTVTLTNGCHFSFPPTLVQGLQSATPAQLSEAEILGAGYGLHWEALNVDISVPGLLAGVFGTASYMASLAGRTKTAAKAAASRSNGAKGGRPRKTA